MNNSFTGLEIVGEKGVLDFSKLRSIKVNRTTYAINGSLELLQDTGNDILVRINWICFNFEQFKKVIFYFFNIFRWVLSCGSFKVVNIAKHNSDCQRERGVILVQLKNFICQRYGKLQTFHHKLIVPL